MWANQSVSLALANTSRVSTASWRVVSSAVGSSRLETSSDPAQIASNTNTRGLRLWSLPSINTVKNSGRSSSSDSITVSASSNIGATKLRDAGQTGAHLSRFLPFYEADSFEELNL